VTRIVSEALLLRSFDFGESDRIVHLLLPEQGRLTAIAKGARRSVRRFPGTLDLFNRLRVQVEQRRRTSMPRLDAATLERAYLGVRLHPARYALGSYLTELIDRLAPEGGVPDDCRRLFDFAEAAWATIETHLPDARLRVLLELRALDAVGMCPELGRCVRCGRGVGDAREVGFHVPEGGPVCRDCLAERDALLRVHRGTLRVLEQALRFDLARLGRLSLGGQALVEASGLIRRLGRFHLGVELRSERFLDETLPLPT